MISIAANVKHRHGVTPDLWFFHSTIEVAGEKTSAKWLETVDEESYGKRNEEEYEKIINDCIGGFDDPLFGRLFKQGGNRQ